MYLSMDSNFDLLQDKPAVQIVDDGITIKFAKADFNWCVKCWVYVIINVYHEQRYYVTAKAFSSRETFMDKIVPVDVVVNPFQQECYGYQIQSKKRDCVFSVTEYSGHADAYVTSIAKATGPDDPFIYFKDAHGPKRRVVIDANLRSQYGTMTGNHYICFYATTPFTA